MTPDQFIRKWQDASLKERSAAQEHFIDLCRLLDHPTPAEADPNGDWFAFEYGAKKAGGGDGWADVWKRDCFGWEYKGKGKDLQAAFRQLQLYAPALHYPPLLIVCDLDAIVIHTAFTNAVQEIHVIPLAELADSAQRQKLHWAFTEPERLRPGRTRTDVTAEAAAKLALLAESLRGRGHHPQAVAHFLTQCLFCLFAEDVGLLAKGGFTRRTRGPQAVVGFGLVQRGLQQQGLFTQERVRLVGSGQTQTVFGVQGVNPIGLHRRQGAALVGQVGQKTDLAQQHQLKRAQDPRRAALCAGEQLHRAAVVVKQTRVGIVAGEQAHQQFVEVAAREQGLARGHDVSTLPLCGFERAHLGLTAPRQQQRLQGQQDRAKLGGGSFDPFGHQGHATVVTAEHL
jgi:hypothetical protein